MNTQIETSDQQLQEYEGFEPSDQQPLGSGNFLNVDDDLPLVEEESSSKINSSAVIITMFILVSVGAVFAMRTISKSNNTAFASNLEVENQIEIFLDSMASQNLSDGSGMNSSSSETTVLKVLSTTYSDRQVKLEDVKKNPFITVADASNQAQTQANPNPDGISLKKWNIQRELLREQFIAASQKITVNSLMSGSSPLASLNGKIVREGETITVGSDEVQFTVESIQINTVTMVAESAEYDLRIQFTLGLKKK